MTTDESRKKAEVIYDAGPRFEAYNQINREAWVVKIAEALTAEYERGKKDGIALSANLLKLIRQLKGESK